MSIDRPRSLVIAKPGAAPPERAFASIPVDVIDKDAPGRADVVSGDYIRGQVRNYLFEAGLFPCMTRTEDPRGDRFFVYIANNQELVAQVVARILGMEIVVNGRKVVLEIDELLMRQGM